MRRVTFYLLVITALAFLTAASGKKADGPDGTVQLSPKAKAHQLVQMLGNYYSMKTLEDGTYVGSEFCISCHEGHATWRDTKHAQALRRPMAQYSLMPGKGVVADYDRNGVDDFQQGLNFNEISSKFDQFKPNAPILGFADGTYTITIGELTMPVVCTQGGTGDWKQRYLLRVPVTGTADGYSAENYVSPIQYNEKTYEYVIYHAEAWYDDAGEPRFSAGVEVTKVAAENGRTYSKKCIGCHTTGLRDIGQDANGEWRYRPYPAGLFRSEDPSYFDYDHDGISDIVNIGCESCHGPGSKHILGAGDPLMIVNPDKLETTQANEVCGQCHSRTKSVPNGTHGWPFDDENNQSWYPGSGEALVNFFSDAAGRWPDDETSRQHHQQYFDFLASSKPDFRFHPVKCIECHDSHGKTTNKHLIRDVMPEDDLLIPSSNDDNTLCLSCHATHGAFEEIAKEDLVDMEANRDHIAKVVSAHTKHPYAPERSMGLSRCSKCHMPTTAKSAINYDVHSHTFEVISPEKTLAYQEDGGMPNSCAVSCHAVKVNSFGLGMDPDISDWDAEFDAKNAEILMHFFGPGGIWWDHSMDEGDEGGGE